MNSQIKSALSSADGQRSPAKVIAVFLALLVAGLGTAVALENDLTLLIFSVISVLIVFGLSFSFTKQSILLFIFLKPIIDTAWENELPGLGLSPLELSGVFIPLIILAVAVYKKERVGQTFGSYLVIALIILNLLALLRDFMNFGSYVSNSALFFKTLNGLSVYLVFPFLFRTDRDIRQLFLVFIIAGIFPLATGIYQYLLGEASGLRVRGRGEIARITGFYHDSTNFRFYMIQALISGTFYLSSFRLSFLRRVVLVGYLLGCLFLVYHLYTKAGYIIILGGGFLWFFLRGNRLFAVSLALLFVSTYFAIDFVRKDIDELLKYEMRFASDELNQDLNYTLLRGRVGIWERYLGFFQNAGVYQQVLGIRSRGAVVHNDFLRILFSNGIVGLLLYVFFLIMIGWRILKEFLRTRDNFAISAIVTFFALIVDSMGLTPTLYPGYQAFTFGVFSLVINRRLVSQETSRTVIKEYHQKNRKK